MNYKFKSIFLTTFISLFLLVTNVELGAVNVRIQSIETNPREHRMPYRTHPHFNMSGTYAWLETSEDNIIVRVFDHFGISTRINVPKAKDDHILVFIENRPNLRTDTIDTDREMIYVIDPASGVFQSKNILFPKYFFWMSTFVAQYSDYISVIPAERILRTNYNFENNTPRLRSHPKEDRFLYYNYETADYNCGTKTEESFANKEEQKRKEWDYACTGIEADDIFGKKEQISTDAEIARKVQEEEAPRLELSSEEIVRELREAEDRRKKAEEDLAALWGQPTC